MKTKGLIQFASALADARQRLSWPYPVVLGKHCMGGVPGNRTAPIVVSIVAACGFIIPKISTAAIVYPANTAQTMGVLTRVDLGINEMRRVVDQEGGCFTDSRSVGLSFSSSDLVRIERNFRVDWEAHIVAMALSEIQSVGSTHVCVEIPVGLSARVTDEMSAIRISNLLKNVGKNIGMQIETCLTDGSQPVGNGIGPALEARDVLSVLREDKDAPWDLRMHSIGQAGQVLEHCGFSKKGEGAGAADQILREGMALQKFLRICELQGGFNEPVPAGYKHEHRAVRSGFITSIGSSQIARAALLAGAPEHKTSGIDLHAQCGEWVEKGQPIFTVYAENGGNLECCKHYLDRVSGVIQIDSVPAHLNELSSDSIAWGSESKSIFNLEPDSRGSHEH